MIKKILRPSISIFSIMLLIFVWQAVSLDFDFPSPIDVFDAFRSSAISGELRDNISVSLYRVLIGFSIALGLGVLFGFFCGLIPLIRSVIQPILEVLRPIPPIAWIPLSVIFFGIGNSSAYFVIFIGAFFPIFINTLTGVLETPKKLKECAALLGASKFEIATEVVWQSSRPYIFSGISIGIGFAWMVVVAAEMVAVRSGLGYQIQIDRQLLNTAGVIANMIVIGVLGFLLVQMSNFANWLLSKHIPIKFYRRLYDSDQEIQLSERELLVDKQVSNKNRELAVEMTNVTFSYESENPIISNLSLKLNAGDIVCLMGTSGVGKSTILRLIAGLESPDDGKIKTFNQLPELGRMDVGMLFQEVTLFGWKNSIQNVEYPMKLRGIENSKIRSAIALNRLMQYGLSKLSYKYPAELSGGQQQRVAIARAMSAQNKLLLVDEAFVGLDHITKENLQTELLNTISKQQMTLILVSHDIYEAAYMADRVLVFNNSGALDELELAAYPRNNRIRTSEMFQERLKTIRNGIS